MYKDRNNNLDELKRRTQEIFQKFYYKYIELERQKFKYFYDLKIQFYFNLPLFQNSVFTKEN